MSAARTLPLCLATALLLPLPALANPIATHVLRVRQVPSTLHVQVTFGADTAFAGEDFKAPAETTRDGQAVEPDWIALGGGYTANTGSGLTSVSALQFCDCSVPEGEHSYSVKPPPHDYEMEASVTVEAGYEGQPTTDPPDAQGSEATDVEVMPWDIPEPSAIQGLDCVAFCATPVGEDAGSAPVDAAPASDAQGGAVDEGAPTDPPADDGTAAAADTPSSPSGPAADTATPAEDDCGSNKLMCGNTGGGVAAARDATGAPPALPSTGGGDSCAAGPAPTGLGAMAALGLALLALLAILRRRRS
jgi:MYXO-CTERM domain-containing protein